MKWNEVEVKKAVKIIDTWGVPCLVVYFSCGCEIEKKIPLRKEIKNPTSGKMYRGTRHYDHFYHPKVCGIHWKFEQILLDMI
jgi:hypothetical protein